MYLQILAITPSNVDIQAKDANGDYIEGNGTLSKLAVMRAEWMEHTCPDGGSMMPGTQVVANEKLNHFILDVPTEDPLTFLTGQIAMEGKPWRIVGMDYYYHKDKYAFDAELDRYVESPPDLMLSTEIEPFLLDVEGQRPTLPVPLHAIDGNVQMVVPA